jgi:hypothetical protein
MAFEKLRTIVITAIPHDYLEGKISFPFQARCVTTKAGNDGPGTVESLLPAGSGQRTAVGIAAAAGRRPACQCHARFGTGSGPGQLVTWRTAR